MDPDLKTWMNKHGLKDEALQKLDAFIRGAARANCEPWADDLAQDVRIALYEWMQQKGIEDGEKAEFGQLSGDV